VPADWSGGVRHEGGVSLVCRACTERGKASIDTAAAALGVAASERERAGRQTPEALSTEAVLAGGPARSSAEARVMRVERRGRLIVRFVRTSNQGAAVLMGGDEWTSRVQ
jgi:hypothetical protein